MFAFLFCQDPIETLSSRLDSLQKQVATNSVEHALDTVRQLANRPRPLVDNCTLLAALEQLSDVAREAGHEERKKFDAILRQCKPLSKDDRLASVVIQLLGDKEEKQVAMQIQKLLKSTAPQVPTHTRGEFHPYQRPAQGNFVAPRPLMGPRFRGAPRGNLPSRNRCFSCGGFGHFARNCQNRAWISVLFFGLITFALHEWVSILCWSGIKTLTYLICLMCDFFVSTQGIPRIGQCWLLYFLLIRLWLNACKTKKLCQNLT